jgi:hypothetical protein
MTSMLFSRGGEGASTSHAQALANPARVLRRPTSSERLRRAGRIIYLRLIRQNDDPNKIAKGLGLGVSLGFFPTFGVGTALAVSLLSVRPPQMLAEQREDARTATNAYSIPEGTPFKLHLHSTISSKASRIGERVLTTLVDPVAVEDTDVLPKGLRIDGHIDEVEAAGHRGKSGCLTIVFDGLELPNGEKVPILGSLTEVYFIKGDGDPRVTPGGLCGGGASRKTQVAIVASAAAGGASAGAGAGVAAGMVGALVAYLLPSGKEAALSAGSVVGMRLDRELTIRLPHESGNSVGP